jgi:hypothetical protein
MNQVGGVMRTVASHSGRVPALVGIALTLTLALSAAIAPSVATAASNPPWRFKTVSRIFSQQPGTETDWPLQCPSGYRPVSGGIAWSQDYPSGHPLHRAFEYTDQPTGTYHVDVFVSGFEPSAVQGRLTANCVWLGNFGDIQYVTNSFTRDSSTHRSSGRVDCPDGYRVITGGADWDYHGGKESVDYSTPILDNNGFGVAWFAMGYNGDSSRLFVEAYCVEAAYLASEYATVDLSNAATADYQDRVAEAFCPQGYRILTGGSRPWSLPYPRHDHGWSWASGPASAQSWPARASLANGDQLAAVALCIPASQVSLDLTQSPDSPTNDTDATWAFDASDQAGEDLLIRCELDNGGKRPSNTASTCVYHNLSEGIHTFTVSISNQSGSSRSISTAWRIDLTKPELSSWAPIAAAPITGPITMTFSESVGGINATTVKLLRNHGNAVVPGTITYVSPSVVRFTPATPLIPGETYSMVLDQAIHDAASNHLTTTYFAVRTDTNIENDSPALHEAWDTDARSVASGGRVITSNALGSHADWSFSATAGQVARLFGVRLPDGGSADVYLDGVKQRTASFFATTPTRAKVYQSDPLAAGPHVLSIRPLGTHPAGSTDSWVSIDSVQLGTKQFEEKVLVQSFKRVALSNASGGTFDTVGYASDSDGSPAYQAKVVGTGIEIHALKSPGSGKARILIDGTLRSTVNLNAATVTADVLVFAVNFPDGQHTIRIEPVGTATGKKSAVGIDRLIVR